ncbi:Acyltransferase mokF [Lasiodiplodia hormozganensis]|uniref:Acyltransferase mokF n=1 Tax=Lasiodiplodia hormozganensis TaxID=869390 RepID=A0AA40D7Y4_9PEZI|nr:Acyltransferase mokF [Lasiodiplodia hormozganensis]
MESFNSTVATFLNPQGPDALPLPRVSFGAVNRSGTFKYLKTFGDDAQPGHNADPSDDVDVLWTIASSTKFITTIAALQCVDKGLLTLDGDIGDILPEWKNPKILTGFTESDEPIFVPAKNTVTLRRLLSHNSGIAYAFESPTLQKYQELRGPQPHPTTVKEAYELFLVEEPGTKWMYSPGMDWAGLMIERVTNLPLGAYMQQHIFTPLSLSPDSILYHPDRHPSLLARQAATFRRDATTGSVLNRIPDPSLPTADDFGGGGLVATAPALLAIYAAILRCNTDNDDDGGENGRILSAAMVDEIFSPQLSPQSRNGLASIENVDPGALCGVPRGAAIQYGLGGLLNLEDVEGGRRRKRGSIAWSGMRNYYFWIDREGGVAGLQAMHMLPCGDEKTVELLNAFERAVYAAVGAEPGRE